MIGQNCAPQLAEIGAQQEGLSVGCGHEQAPILGAIKLHADWSKHSNSADAHSASAGSENWRQFHFARFPGSKKMRNKQITQISNKK